MILISAAAAAQEMRAVHYSSGTGFFVSREGHVLTNNHVVLGCKSIMLKGIGVAAPALLAARDSANDLALLKVEAVPQEVASLRSDSMPLQPGEKVVTVGFPGSQGLTTREGVLKETRGPTGHENLLLFSNASAKGNSGGPLLDAGANVIGVVQAKATVVTRYTLNGQVQKETKDNSDVAISLPVVENFLIRNRVQMRRAAAPPQFAAHRVADRARQFVVHVLCRQD